MRWSEFKPQLSLLQVSSAEEAGCDPAEDDGENEDYDHDDVLVVALDPV